MDQLTFGLIVGGFGILAYTFVKGKGKVNVDSRRVGEYNREDDPVSLLVSTKYGVRFITGGNVRYGKPLTYLQGLEKPVSDIVVGDNTFPFQYKENIFGDVPTYIHIDDEYPYQSVRSAFGADEADRLTELIAHNQALKRELAELRDDYREKMEYDSAVIKAVKKNTSAGIPQYKGGRGGVEE